MTTWEEHERREAEINALVARYVLDQYRDEGTNEHLKACPDITTDDAEGSDGSYGCDTGCDYRRFEATITCPHGERDAFEWGEFGTIASIIEDLEREDAPPSDEQQDLVARVDAWLVEVAAAMMRGEPRPLTYPPGVTGLEIATRASVDMTLQNGPMEVNGPLQVAFTASLADGTLLRREVRLSP